MPDNPRQNVTFPSNGGEAFGYLAVPAGGRGPGLVVIQEWWGLTDHIAGVADRFAGEGFVALAPDLYGGRTTHDAEEAGRLMQELPADRAARDLMGAVDYLLANDAVVGAKAGVVGFCMGGGFVLSLAAQAGGKVGAAVAFYGVLQEEPDWSALTARVQGHYGEKDDFVPAEAARAQFRAIAEATGTEPELHFYPAGHAFLNDENLLGTYDPQQARIAWDRTVGFLRDNL
ncbi:MAG: dienelactone hydrolase family protein [Actinomycetota bacterium]|nr:dienelactone hydrolase family protein [Actinomycetota bacterium]